MNQMNREKAGLLLLAFFIIILALALLAPPIAQSLSYHNFADSRSLCGISNFGNVASNLAILVGGLGGLLCMFSEKARKTALIFATEAGWWPYLGVFIGATMIAFGSAYYHYKPGNERLIWDRLPMAIMFMALFAAVFAERVSLAAAKILTAPLIFLGVASVVGWALSEHRGAGDLRFYAIVQFFPMVAMPLILWLFPSRYSKQGYLIGSMAWYALAKLFEMFDLQVFVATRGAVSGHTIKHILCGLSVYWLVLMLQKRQPLQSQS
jgi:dsRNA-gated channel SID-1